jgi:hypothetical protein
MQKLTCDEAWWKTVIRDSFPQILLGFHQVEGKSLFVLTSLRVQDIERFGESQQKLQSMIPGGLNVVGLGFFGNQSASSHASLQKILCGIGESSIVLQLNGISGKPSVRILEGGLLKPLSMSPCFETIQFRNVVMRFPVEMDLPDEWEDTQLREWFMESVLPTTETQENDSNIYIQSALVRTSDYNRPRKPFKTISGVITLSCVVPNDKEPLENLCDSFVRRLRSTNAHEPRYVYLAIRSSTFPILYCLPKRHSLDLGNLSLWEHAFNTFLPDVAWQRHPVFRHVLLILVSLIVFYFIIGY